MAMATFRAVTAGLDPMMIIQDGDTGTRWKAPRLYIAMHGLQGAFMHEIADYYGWEKLA